MLSACRAFFDAWGWLLDLSGFIVSVLTLITALRFRRRFNKTLDRNDFLKNQEALCKELDGYLASLHSDGLDSSDSFLEKIDCKLDEIQQKYSFLSFRLRMELRQASRLLKKKLGNTSFRPVGKNYSYKLQKHIRHIRIMLEKESRL